MSKVNGLVFERRMSCDVRRTSGSSRVELFVVVAVIFEKLFFLERHLFVDKSADAFQ